MRKVIAEKARLVPAIVLVGILVFSSLSILSPDQRWTSAPTISPVSVDSTQTALTDEVVDRAVNYLYVNYNNSIGLNYVSPDYPDSDLNSTYFIYSDNYLASLVLRTYDLSNPTLVGRGENIKNNYTYYRDRAGANNTTLLPFTNQYRVLSENVSDISDSAFHGAEDIDLNADINLTRLSGATVRTTINNGDSDLDPKEFADIAFLQAIYHKLRDESGAMEDYVDGLSSAVNLSDGMGFKDKPFYEHLQKYNEESYQTYKLALYIYASRLLRQEDYNRTAFDRALHTLPKMQARNEGISDGGFSTGYDSSLQAIRGQNGSNGTNTETTSLAVLALSFGEVREPDSLLAIAAIVVIALAVIVAVAYFFIRRKRALPPQTPITPPKT